LIGCYSRLPSYKGFVLNYNMRGMSKSLSELFAMLTMLMVNNSMDFKKYERNTKGPKGKP
jgi:hypothetical protein